MKTMAKLETDSAEIPFPATQEAPPAAQGGKGGNCEAVRFNVLQHGILSRHTEDAGEYRALVTALLEEHQLAATEAHLAEELAEIIQRPASGKQVPSSPIRRERRQRVKTSTSRWVLVVPASDRENLLLTYQAEKTWPYGERTGTDMAKTLETWVRARGVH